MRLIGAYKILYNPDYHVLCRPDGEFVFNSRSEKAFNKAFYERKEEELEFQVNLWNLLKQNHNDYADEELLINLMLLLSDSTNEAAENIAVFVEELFKLTAKEGDTEFQCACQQLVRRYKSLNPGPLILPTQKEPENTEFSFNPTINKRSRELATQTLNKALSRNSSTQKYTFDSRIMRMYDKRRETEEKYKQLRALKEREELAQCTFRPVISQRKKRPATRLRTGCKVEKEIMVKSKGNLDLKGAKWEKRQGKENREDGNSVRKRVSKKEPLMRVEVNILANRKGTLVLYKGESLYEVIEKFAHVHQLSKENVEDLYKQLKEQTDQL
eukprot:TRINITY_DN10798_c0_g1_i8.p1 TRINITY_DN10798_c0_g1~~TRINITY_DN10798_c0_g1_i8.p1  ORF type:complete len:328 (+),score=80.26 TRINITY_DN10798_c0_g1_i8:537-1520(+)